MRVVDSCGNTQENGLDVNPVLLKPPRYNRKCEAHSNGDSLGHRPEDTDLKWLSFPGHSV